MKKMSIDFYSAKEDARTEIYSTVSIPDYIAEYVNSGMLIDTINAEQASDKTKVGTWLYGRYTDLAYASMYAWKNKITSYKSRLLISLKNLAPYYNSDTKITGNWWEWNIGVPMQYSFVTLFIDSCDDNYEPALKRFVRNKIKNGDLTYANLATSCKILMLLGLNTKNNTYVTEALKLAVPAFTSKTVSQYNTARKRQVFSIKHPKLLHPTWMYSGKEGIFSDGSFIQHTSVPATCSYGIEMIEYVNFVCAVLGFDSLYDDIKASLPSWFQAFVMGVYDGKLVHMFCGRSIYECDNSGMQERAIREVNKLAKTVGLNTLDEYDTNSFISIMPMSDRAITQTATYRICVAMSSDRTARYESMGNQNMYGKNQGDGVVYIYKRGKTELNMTDLHATLLPGVSTKYSILSAKYDSSTHPLFDYQSKEIDTLRAGGAADTGCDVGVAGMDFIHNDVSGHKSWHMYKNCIICLGSKIIGDDVVTVVDSYNKEKPIALPGTKGSKQKWYYQNRKILYVPITNDIEYDENTSSLLIHNDKSYNLYGYAIIPEISKTDAVRFGSNIELSVLAGGHRVSRDNIETFYVYSDNGCEFCNSTIDFNTSCAAVVKHSGDRLYINVSDYKQDNCKVVMKLQGLYKLTSSSEGKATIKVKDGVTTITFDTKNRLGSSVNIVVDKLNLTRTSNKL